jgi:hypothetical protein
VQQADSSISLEKTFPQVSAERDEPAIHNLMVGNCGSGAAGNIHTHTHTHTHTHAHTHTHMHTCTHTYTHMHTHTHARSNSMSGAAGNFSFSNAADAAQLGFAVEPASGQVTYADVC